MSVPTVKGGDYDAMRAKDGTWTILDVPIFADCARSFKLPNGKVVTATFDRAWQEAAVKRAKEKHAASGVMRSIYPRHKHDPKDVRDTIGFFLPKRVEDVELRGGKRAVTFADYVGVPDAAYAELKSRKHPYKSVELPIGADPEFTGLAWLKEPPFHDDFALQTIGKEISDPGTSDGVVGFAADVGLSAHALVRFSMPDAPFAKKPEDETKPEGAAPAASTVPGAPDPAAPAAVPPGAAGPAANEPAAVPPLADPAVAAAPKPDESVGPMLSGLMAMVARVEETLKRLVGGTQTDGSGAPRAGAVQAAFDASGTPTADFAAVTAENAALRTEVEAFKNDATKRDAVAKAVKSLDGYALGGDPVEIVTARFDAGGVVGLESFVAGIALVGKKDPDAAWARDTARAPVEPLAAKYPGFDALIAEFGAQYDSIPAVARGAITRDRHIELALAHAGISEKK